MFLQALGVTLRWASCNTSAARRADVGVCDWGVWVRSRVLVCAWAPAVTRTTYRREEAGKAGGHEQETTGKQKQEGRAGTRKGSKVGRITKTNLEHVKSVTFQKVKGYGMDPK